MIIMIIRVAVKMEVKNKRRKELPLSKEVEMLTMLHEGGHHPDADADDSHHHNQDAYIVDMENILKASGDSRGFPRLIFFGVSGRVPCLVSLTSFRIHPKSFSSPNPFWFWAFTGGSQYWQVLELLGPNLGELMDWVGLIKKLELIDWVGRFE